MLGRVNKHIKLTLWKELTVPCQFFLFVLVATIWAGCENDMATVHALIEQERIPTETGKDVEIEYSELGEVRSRVTAPTMKRFTVEENATEFPDGVQVKNYGSSGIVESTLEANYGIMYQKEERVYLRDDVVLVNTKGEQLNCEELNWNWKTKRIFSDKFVKITTPEEVIWGKGFEANDDFSWYRIDSITGNFSVETDEVE